MSEYLNDSSSWTQVITLPYQPNVRAYRAIVSEGQIIRLAGVWDWGVTPPPTPTAPVTPGTPAPLPAPALMPEPGFLVFQRVPTTSGYFQATFVCNVKLPVGKDMLPEAPHWLMPVWHVGILDGVLGKMMTSPSKSYSNAVQGAYHLKRFRDAIARARVSKLRANTIGSSAWSYPQSFRSLSQQSGVPAIGSANERSF
jgi:hypothetical protein